MVDLALRDFDREEWDSLAAGFAGFSLMQCWAYGEAKARTGPWRVERGVFSEGGRTVGCFQALVRRLPAGLPGGLAWINRGPLWHGTGLAMAAALRRHYTGMYLRLAPPLAEGEGDLAAAGFEAAGTPGWASAVLDLTPPVEALRKGLRQKWRNALNKAERSAIDVESGSGDGLLAAFAEGHRRLTEERAFATSVTVDLVRVLQDLLPAERKLEVFVASAGDAPVASVLIARYGDTAEYLAGNMSDEGRRLNAGQLLLWRAVCAMKERGFGRFDLGGLDPDLTPAGIRHFKEGLGGVPYRLAPEVEAVGGVLGRLVRWRVRRARPGREETA